VRPRLRSPRTFNKKVEELTGQIKGADPKKIEEGVLKTMTPKLDAANKRGDALHTQLKNVLVNGDSIRALTGETDQPELVLPFITTQVKVVEQDGNFQVHVVDENGETRFSGTQPMTIKQLVAEMKTNAKYARLFNSEAPAGTGGKGQHQQQRNAAAAAGVGGGNQTLSSTAKIAQGLKKGQFVTNRG
jgi:hypothetical protein